MNTDQIGLVSLTLKYLDSTSYAIVLVTSTGTDELSGINFNTTYAINLRIYLLEDNEIAEIVINPH